MRMSSEPFSFMDVLPSEQKSNLFIECVALATNEKLLPVVFNFQPEYTANRKRKQLKLLIGKYGNMNDEDAIVAVYRTMCEAMISGDIQDLKQYFGDSVSHINGSEQSTEDWLLDIKEGNMKYYWIGLEDVRISKEGDEAMLHCITVLDASIYGIRKKWNLSSSSRYKRLNDGWQMIPDTSGII